MPGNANKNQPVPRKPVPQARPLSVPPRPATPAAAPLKHLQNIKRAEERDLRRAGARQAANQIQNERPRPVVRPLAPPQKVMPNTPPPRPSVTAVKRPIAGPPMPRQVAPAAAAAVTGAAALNASAAHQTLSAEAAALQSSLSDLQTRISFNDVTADINRLDADLRRVNELLESGRQKGYRYGGDMEESLYRAMGDWEAARPQVLSSIQQQAAAFQNQAATLNPQVNRLNVSLNNPPVATPLLRSTQTLVNNMLQNVADAQRNLENSYAAVESTTQKLSSRLTQVHWAMDQLSEAKFKLAEGEDLVMAVAARWDKEGKDDPEGILYLTDKRLVFERKEKVATKKVLFITTASELVHEVLIDQLVSSLRNLKAENKGLFGHQDFLMVEFGDAKTGQANLHLNGQDCKEWQAMIAKVQNGQIQAERYNASTGVSATDLNRPITTADLMILQSEVNGLQDEMMLQSSRQELSALENDVRSLERTLAGLRARGYEIEKDLEADVAVLAAQWDRVKKNSETTLEYQARSLNQQMTGIQRSLAQMMGMSNNLSAARPLYIQLKSTLASASAQADAAQSTVLAQYDEYADEVEALSAHMEWVGWMLDALSTASFRLLATEAGVAATEAVYQMPSGVPENGVLFLTDKRLLWEDRVDTYELKVNVPLAEVFEVKVEQKEPDCQTLIFSFGASAPAPIAQFELSLPVGEEWVKMVGRARTGGYAQDRAVSLSADELERIQNAPQQCSQCGAAFTAPLLRGQTEIHCEYCGLVTRL